MDPCGKNATEARGQTKLPIRRVAESALLSLKMQRPGARLAL